MPIIAADGKVYASAYDCALSFGFRLCGVRYAPWRESNSDNSGAPLWMCHALPSMDVLMEDGMNCTGFVNVLSLAIGGEAHFDWFAFLAARDVLEKYDRDVLYPVGTLLLRGYTDEDDQGHVAFLAWGTTIMHSYARLTEDQSFVDILEGSSSKLDPGVTTEDVCHSHSWYKGGTYTHVCRPANWMPSTYSPL